MSNNSTNPVRLYIGSPEIINAKALSFAESIFCKNLNSGQDCPKSLDKDRNNLDQNNLTETNLENNLNNKAKKLGNISLNKHPNKCLDCNLITNNKHWNLRILKPKSGSNYTIDDLEVLFEILKFKLGKDDKYCIIIEKAELLSPICANSLLKSLEEPPENYFILLLANNKNSLLPTVISRCVIEYFDQDKNSFDLIKFFDFNSKLSSVEFAKAIDKQELLEVNIINLLDNLTAKFLDLRNQQNLNFNKALNLRTDQTTNLSRDLNSHSYLEFSEFSKIIGSKLEILNNARENLPLPGSAKFFLKNLFLKLNIADY